MKLQKKINTCFSEIKKNPSIYVALFIILIVAFFVRVYRTEALLGFYYDLSFS